MSTDNNWWATRRDNNDLLHETPSSRVYAWIELMEGPFSVTEAEEACRRLRAEHHEYMVRTHDPDQEGYTFCAYSEDDFPKLRRMGTTIIEH
jgi:hypothetical protein